MDQTRRPGRGRRADGRQEEADDPVLRASDIQIGGGGPYPHRNCHREGFPGPQDEASGTYAPRLRSGGGEVHLQDRHRQDEGGCGGHDRHGRPRHGFRHQGGAPLHREGVQHHLRHGARGRDPGRRRDGSGREDRGRGGKPREGDAGGASALAPGGGWRTSPTTSPTWPMP